jgi:N-acetyl-anhydromuramyl-L-alanine amidase AmpD
MAEPPITIRATFSSHAVGDNPNPTRVVIHATCPTTGYSRASAAGQALATARYFAGANAHGSAHYIEDVAVETHCVPDSTVAYHAPPNGHSIGIEICAEGGQYAQSYTRDQWLSPQVWPAVQRAAARTRELCQRFGIPAVKLSVADLQAGKRGVCGHVDVSKAWHQSTHSDPGDGFPWDKFMQAVGGAAIPSTVSVPAPVSTWASLPDLAFGQTNASIGSLQRFLNAFNWVPALPLLPVTGYYGDQTAGVLKSAQAQMKVTGGDGRNIGPQTKQALWARGWRG